MKVATDIYTFIELRGLGFHYVDKTAGILSLVNASIGKQFFYAGDPEEVLAQIEEKGYAAKFASDPRKFFRIGCAFDWDKRNLGPWLIVGD